VIERTVTKSTQSYISYHVYLKKDSELPVVKLHRIAKSLSSRGGSNLVMCRDGGIEGGGGVEGEGMIFVLGRGGQRWTFEKTTKPCTDQHSKKHLRRTNSCHKWGIL